MNRSIIICLLIISFSACKSEYDRYVRSELKKGIVNDSLIFGMRMGQTQKDFFAICWELNSQKLISQGTGNQMAKYLEPLEALTDSTMRKEMEFYGIFDDEKIMKGMNMIFRFTSWSPWNKESHSQPLALHLKDVFLNDYGGNEFITIDLDNTEYKAYVKVDGNRQILIYPINTKDVAVKIEDLNYKLNSI